MIVPANSKITPNEALFLMCLVDNRIREYTELRKNSPKYWRDCKMESILRSCEVLRDKLLDVYMEYENELKPKEGK